jgi:hypothetical protein
VELNGIEASRSRCEQDAVALRLAGGFAPQTPQEVASSIQQPNGVSVAQTLKSAEVGFGGADQDRTGDLLNAIQALSQTELQPHGGSGGYQSGAGEGRWRSKRARQEIAV